MSLGFLFFKDFKNMLKVLRSMVYTVFGGLNRFSGDSLNISPPEIIDKLFFGVLPRQTLHGRWCHRVDEQRVQVSGAFPL